MSALPMTRMSLRCMPSRPQRAGPGSSRTSERPTHARPQILVPHDDGCWYRATLLGRHRDRADGHWRAGVRYYVGPGQQYQRVLRADDCRAVDNPPPGWVDPSHDVRTVPRKGSRRRAPDRAEENMWLW